MITIEKRWYPAVPGRRIESTFYEMLDDGNKIGEIAVFSSAVKEHPFTKKEEKDIYYLGSFLVYGEHRRKGYGRQLIKRIKEDYKGKVLVLDAQSFGTLLQEDLINFYASEGFKFTNEEEKNKPEGSKQRMFIEL
jgi:GNAT superfamily N-acetyltransferase